jgi:hypothetical protein
MRGEEDGVVLEIISYNSLAIQGENHFTIIEKAASKGR